jgi:molybdenum ABC transporter molybdate-binding protein
VTKHLYRPWIALGVTAIVVGVSVVILTRKHPSHSMVGTSSPLIVFCAAGVRAPVESIARQYEQAYGTEIQLQYGGSQTLFANLSVAQRGDLYLPGDEAYLTLAREKGLVAETLPLANMSAVLAVRKGNPKNIRALEDLFREKITIALANPEAAAVGKVTRDWLEKSGHWNTLKQHTAVFKPTVNDVANDLKLGTADAGIIWDVTVRQYPELVAIPVPALSQAKASVIVGVLRSSEQPTAALRFARYLAARDRGLQQFARAGYPVVEGDEWAVTPELVLYSGAMNRVAVEKTLNQFEQREGIHLTRVYNGCGILVAQMKAGGRPDAYLTCDQSFVPPVADLFPTLPVEISDSQIVLLAPKGNPHLIKSLADLAKPGLRIGVANPEQSTLGALTRRLLEQAGLFSAVMTNVVTQTPTADLLVNQMRTGALDATVVYISNTTQVKDQLDIIPLNLPGAIAVQTYSIRPNSKFKYLAQRLLDALKSEESRARYKQAGFHWRNHE